VDDPAYELIRRFYGERRARRSGVRLMNHIDEGLRILDALGAPLEAKRAFCLHPLVQADEDLVRALAADGLLRAPGLDPVAVALALEYRSVANEYLSKREVRSLEEIRLSPLAEVNAMLVADKVQNRRDFERFHRDTHPRSAELARYFENWLRRLGISEERYRELVGVASSEARAPWWLEPARAAGPVAPGAFRVVVEEPRGRTLHHDFPTRAEAVAYADDVASEVEEHPGPLAVVLDAELRLVDRGMHYASRRMHRPLP
jgi:hypothetical protein